MAQSLPENPDIAWLKKSAKQLLRKWREDGRDVKLSDAQFHIAKSYGFSSWRQLQKNIQSVQAKKASDPAVHFLQAVGDGDMVAIENALSDNPDLIHVVGPHPFWGGRPQALHVAVETNRKPVVELLLRSGADPDGNNSGYDNWSPLMLALFQDRSELSAMLISKGASIGLCEALLMADDGRVEALIDRGDVPSAAQRPQGSLLALARTQTAIADLMKLGELPESRNFWGADAMEALSRLGERGRPLVEAMSVYGQTIGPEELARTGNLSKLQTLARSGQADVFSDAVFMAAVDFGHHEMAKWMLSYDANVNARASWGSQGTALHSAAWNGDLEMARILIDAGADLHALDHEHQNTALGWTQVSRQVTNNPDCDEVRAYLEAIA